MSSFTRSEFRTKMLRLDHKNPTDFYVGCFQTSQSLVPLLCVRIVLFVGSLSILLASVFMMKSSMGFGLWFIYLTHWGLILLTVTTAYGLLLSIHALTGDDIVDTYEMSWSLKLYWILYNVTVTIALLISLFYWTVLRGSKFLQSDKPLIDPTLDYLIHGANSAVALVMLFTSQTPSRLLHVYQPVTLALVYLMFSIVYYAAGGLDPLGHSWIYPMLDWSQPLKTSWMATLTAVGLLIIHAGVVTCAVLRDAVAARCTRHSHTLHLTNTL